MATLEALEELHAGARSFKPPQTKSVVPRWKLEEDAARQVAKEIGHLLDAEVASKSGKSAGKISPSRTAAAAAARYQRGRGRGRGGHGRGGARGGRGAPDTLRDALQHLNLESPARVRAVLRFIAMSALDDGASKERCIACVSASAWFTQNRKLGPSHPENRRMVRNAFSQLALEALERGAAAASAASAASARTSIGGRCPKIPKRRICLFTRPPKR